jgi:hypothetical protein
MEMNKIMQINLNNLKTYIYTSMHKLKNQFWNCLNVMNLNLIIQHKYFYKLKQCHLLLYSKNKYILTLSTEDESETNLRNMFVNFINGQNPINISFMTLFLSKLPKDNKWTQYPNKLGDWNFYSKYTGSAVQH